MSDRKVLIHYHIFKNAGSSVDAMRTSSFGLDHIHFESQTYANILSREALAGFLHQNTHIRAVSSHQARPPLPLPGCRPIVFLRHPLLRVRSIRDFVALDAGQPWHEIARQGLVPYVEWALRNPGGIAMRDYQVVHLSEASFRTPILDARARPPDLQQAKELIAEWGAVGIVERFDASIAALKRAFEADFPIFTAEPVWINRTSTAPPCIATGLGRLRAELGDDLYDALGEANRLDLELYEFAVATMRPAIDTSAREDRTVGESGSGPADDQTAHSLLHRDD